MIHEGALRDQLAGLLGSAHAHVDLDGALAALPVEQRGARPPGQPHTVWRLLEHLRIAQWDILEFSRDPRHASPEWPSGYWPASDAPAGEQEWRQSRERYAADLAAFRGLLLDPGRDLFAVFPWGTGQTLLREALVLADHQAYHVGQIVSLRQLLGSWPPRGEE
jgi:uncharacterized damage-inducible protein DinB